MNIEETDNSFELSIEEDEPGISINTAGPNRFTLSYAGFDFFLRRSDMERAFGAALCWIMKRGRSKHVSPGQSPPALRNLTSS